MMLMQSCHFKPNRLHVTQLNTETVSSTDIIAGNKPAKPGASETFKWCNTYHILKTFLICLSQYVYKLVSNKSLS